MEKAKLEIERLNKEEANGVHSNSNGQVDEVTAGVKDVSIDDKQKS